MLSKAILINLLLAVAAMSVTSFSLVSSTVSDRARLHYHQRLQLHPDQADELEAAASEMLKLGVFDSDDNLDDTKHDQRSHLSAASATSSSIPTQKAWWSKTFFSFIRGSRGQ